MDILENMNPEQIEAIKHLDGPCLVTACPGSGKTESVVRRMAYLVKHQNVEPHHILGLTFGKDAADEMDRRMRAIIGEETMVKVQTFHSFCRRVLAEEMPGFSKFGLDDKDQYRQLAKKAIGYEHMKWDGADVHDLCAYLELAKASAFEPDSAEAKELAIARYRSRSLPRRDPEKTVFAYQLIEEHRRAAGFMTFSDWLVEVNKLFSRDENVRRQWAAIYRYVIVDEAQDNNSVQIKIGHHMAKDHRNLMLVGDPAQSLYGFRGSVPSSMTSFVADWGARVITMTRNYRSRTAIVENANKSLETMALRVTTDSMVANHTDAGTVEITKYATSETQAEGVTEKIRALNADGVAFSDMAVLYRVNALSVAIEEELANKKVPYRVIGGSCFYKRKEVAGLLSYLRVANRGASIDEFRRSISNPWRFLGNKFTNGIEQARKERLPSVSAIVERAIEIAEIANKGQMSSAREWGRLIDTLASDIVSFVQTQYLPSVLLAKIIMATNYSGWVRNDEGQEAPDSDRVSNVAQLVELSKRFKTTKDFLDHVDNQIKEASEPKKEEEKKDAVNLMSIHKAKGLEWKHVFIISVNADKMPHFYAEDKDEEHRIYYVAITRAKEALYPSFVQEHTTASGTGMRSEPSPFLGNMCEYCDKPHAVECSKQTRAKAALASPQLKLMLSVLGGEVAGVRFPNG